jgi:PTH1 family peptidyl-tRNA hydrolase
MPYIIAGLGNPGEEYENTRHNTGRIVLNAVAKAFDVEDFSFDKKMNALVSKGKIGKEKVIFIEPETFMNKSGKALASIVKVKNNAKLKLKTADNLVVVYDDFQLPIGRIKISYNRSSGGHNGLESVIKAVKTEAFVRIRVGTAAENAKGNARVPHGDEKVLKFILGKYKEDEMNELKKVFKKVAEAVEMIVKEGREKAMSVYNAG